MERRFAAERRSLPGAKRVENDGVELCDRLPEHRPSFEAGSDFVLDPLAGALDVAGNRRAGHVLPALREFRDDLRLRQTLDETEP